MKKKRLETKGGDLELLEGRVAGTGPCFYKPWSETPFGDKNDQHGYLTTYKSWDDPLSTPPHQCCS